MMLSFPTVSGLGVATESWRNLWSLTGYDLAEEQSILLALVVSFIVTGPLLLPMSRRGRYYVKEGQPLLAWQVASKIALLVIPGLYVALLIASLVGTILPHFSPPSPLHFIGFLVALSVLWLATVITFIVGEPLLILVAYMGGNLIASLIRDHFGLPLFPVQVVGILALALFLLTVSLVSVAVKQRRRHTRKAFASPRLSVLFVADVPYMLFGGLYALLLFGDRLIVWILLRSGWEDFPFHAYEAGMTMAILTLFIIGAVMEVLGMHFRRVVLPRALRGRSRRPLLRFFVVSILTFFAAVLLGRTVLATDTVFQGLSRLFSLPENLEPTVGSILAAGVVAYAFIFWGLFQSFLLLEFGEFETAIRAVPAAFAVEIAVGLASAYLFGPLFVLVGMMAGGLLFAVITSARVLHRFRHGHRDLYPAAI